MNAFSTSFGNITLTVSPGEMYSTASGIEEKIKNAKGCFEFLIKRVQATSAYWQGDVAEAERSRFENENENFQNLISNLQNYVEELRKITAIYEVSEAISTNHANSLESNIFN